MQLPPQDIEVEILATATDNNNGRDTASLSRVVPSVILPLIESVDVKEVKYYGEGQNYYTELLVEVNATDPINPDLAKVFLGLQEAQNQRLANRASDLNEPSLKSLLERVSFSRIPTDQPTPHPLDALGMLIPFEPQWLRP